MKMKSISTLLVKGIVLISFIYAGSVSPMLSMRFGDVAAGVIPTPSTVLGLQVEVGDGVVAGVESDAGDSRLFLRFGYGTFGMGSNNLGDPQFTIGGHYDIISNFGVSLDYVLNQLTVDANNANAPFADQLRISLSASF